MAWAISCSGDTDKIEFADRAVTGVERVTGSDVEPDPAVDARSVRCTQLQRLRLRIRHAERAPAGRIRDSQCRYRPEVGCRLRITDERGSHLAVGEIAGLIGAALTEVARA